jgi:methylmalonyl-CoA/ethylmalonyl-CoA epimerase
VARRLDHAGFAETPDMDAELRALRGQGFIPTGPPQPAVAFGGRRVVFLYHRLGQLIELVEAPSTAS